jgi:hypothetical protein
MLEQIEGTTHFKEWIKFTFVEFTISIHIHPREVLTEGWLKRLINCREKQGQRIRPSTPGMAKLPCLDLKDGKEGERKLCWKNGIKKK